MQARIDRVQHAARAGNREIEFQMPVARSMPAWRPDRRAPIQATQGVGHLAGAPVQVAIGVPVKVAFDPPRDDFGVAVVPIRVLDQRWRSAAEWSS
jgi:hypothetical protein